jgi:hypothetical protein
MLRRVLTYVVLALALVAEAGAATCGSRCRGSAGPLGWTKKATNACIKACKRDQRNCRGLGGAARRECRDDSADCSLDCAEVWRDVGQREDRAFCQLVCGSCGRAGKGFCVEGIGSAADDVARCCGGPGEGSCCRSLVSPVTAQCCAGGDTCCTTSGCVDTQNDPRNCGACGAACPEGETCAGGQCSGGACCPRPCTETTPVNDGIRTVTWRQVTTGEGISQIVEIATHWDRCGTTDPFGECIPTTTLVCELNGAEYQCGSFETAIASSQATQALLDAGAYCPFNSTDVLCVVDGRPCAVSFGGDDLTVEQSYSCVNCGAHGPACATETWAGCSCSGGGFPDCPLPCRGRPCP